MGRVRNRRVRIRVWFGERKWESEIEKGKMRRPHHIWWHRQVVLFRVWKSLTKDALLRERERERERESRWRQPPMWRWWWEAVRDCARALAIVVVANERVGWRVICVWEIYKMFYTYFKHKTFYMILPQFYGWPFFYNKTSILNLMDDSMKWGALIYI